MHQSATHYPDWKAPGQDGRILLWPESDQIFRQTGENQRRLGSVDARVQNVALSEVRRRTRQFVGHDDAQPLIATGHQTELYHAGVWAKNVLIDLLAKKLVGRAFHISADTDAPKHLNVRWPGESLPLTDDPNRTSAAWAGLLGAPTPAHLESLRNKLFEVSATWGFRPMLVQVLDSLRRLSLEAPNLSAAVANSLHQLDWELGLGHDVLLASPIWESEPFLLFACDLLAHADSFAAEYNAALNGYRDAAGIRSTTRPMPDLTISGDAVEIPFWLDHLETGERIRPSVVRSEHRWILRFPKGQEFGFERETDGWEAASKLRRCLSAAGCRLSPRALMLTMFVRLFLADQFIHGIGGARYDQVTDRLITSHYGIEPPKFAVTTATLYFPAAVGKQRVCVPCVIQEGHELKHGLLGARKRQMVDQIAALPRRSTQRLEKYMAMQNQLSSAAAGSESMLLWREKLRVTRQREKDEQSLFDRELFYAIQPAERLKALIDQYKSML